MVDLFDEYMRREREFAREEFDAVARGDFAAATTAQARRWFCLQAAGLWVQYGPALSAACDSHGVALG